MSSRRKGVRISKYKSKSGKPTTAATTGKTESSQLLPEDIYESVVRDRGFDPLKERKTRLSS